MALLLWRWGHLACTPTWTSRPLNRTAHCPCRSCQQSSCRVFPSSGHLQARLGARPPQPRSLTAPQTSPASFLPRNGSAQGISHPVTIASPRASLGHPALLLNILSPSYPFLHQTDHSPEEPKPTSSHTQGCRGLLPFCLSLLSLPLPSFSRFFCFLLFFVRFVSFIPSKPPEQLTMSNYSGTFALLPSPQKLRTWGEENAKGRKRQRAWSLAPAASPDSQHDVRSGGAPARPQQDARGWPWAHQARLTSSGPHRDSQGPVAERRLRTLGQS